MDTPNTNHKPGPTKKKKHRRIVNASERTAQAARERKIVRLSIQAEHQQRITGEPLVPCVCPVCSEKYSNYTLLCAHINIMHRNQRKAAIAQAQKEYQENKPQATEKKEPAKRDTPKRQPIKREPTNRVMPSSICSRSNKKPLLSRGVVKSMVKQQRRANAQICTPFRCYLCGYTHMQGGEFEFEGNIYRVCQICRKSMRQLDPYGKEVLVNFEGNRRKH